jgi:hypothetical protein
MYGGLLFSDHDWMIFCMFLLAETAFFDLIIDYLNFKQLEMMLWLLPPLSSSPYLEAAFGELHQ